MSIHPQPIIVEQRFPHPMKTVWKAITEPIQMIQWFFHQIEDFRPEAGFETRFDVRVGEKVYPHLWRIIDVVPGRKIVYHWSYSNYPGVGYVTFELFPEGENTLLKLTNEGLETFPQDVPEFSPESCRAGWEYFIQGNLRDYLESS